ncbi:GNAT family N-acetyltransferase [Microlunatus sp. Gsoil 973]|uniref:GNAT family N-acetyltransferase n=1 Tax=Microlunatus sp. Gsoil 973 TaxID=2672569 RepID=UPI0012B466BF|nr:GNAT family N-acetyltransferase [Microlunatus sp. Gsoil 973]QGN34892.1 GNAT family N-acetyltransferase [Microlunatus sp. Gsoil 973]
MSNRPRCRSASLCRQGAQHRRIEVSHPAAYKNPSGRRNPHPVGSNPTPATRPGIVGRRGCRVAAGSSDDAVAVASLLRTNRAFLARWDPVRDDAWFTEKGQRAELEQALARHDQGLVVPYVIHADGQTVGRLNINNIVRGAFQSAHLGYWVDQAINGRGVATAAVAEAVRRAFGELQLHRLQADTLVHNVASQRVLAHNDFTRIGLAPRYLRIAGCWQDHLLHQRLNAQWTKLPG